MSSRSVFGSFLLLILALLLGCYKSASSQVDVGPIYTPPAGIAPQTIGGVTYGYVAPAERQQALISGYSKLKVGATREEVRALLGAPDWANPIHERQSDKFAGWHYIYEYRRYHPDKRNAHADDQLVQVFFDPSGDRLSWAHANNMADLGEVGSQPP